MSLRTQIARLEAKFRPVVGTTYDSNLVSWQQQSRQERLAFLRRVPADLGPAVDAALDDPDRGPQFAEWAGNICARWATPPDELPRSLVEWTLSANRRWWIGQNCERCGLAVPLLVTWENDTNPPADIRVFPRCPLCGGTTSFRASRRAYGEGD